MSKVELSISVMHLHMEGTLQEIEQPRKFSNEVFTSLLFPETILNGLNIVINDREWAIQIEEMKFPCKGSWWYRFLFMGPFPPSFGNHYILLVMDYVSKWVEVIACPRNDANKVVGFI